MYRRPDGLNDLVSEAETDWKAKPPIREVFAILTGVPDLRNFLVESERESRAQSRPCCGGEERGVEGPASMFGGRVQPGRCCR